MKKEDPCTRRAIAAYSAAFVSVCFGIYLVAELGVTVSNPDLLHLTKYALFSESADRVAYLVLLSGQRNNAYIFVLLEITIPYLNILACAVTAASLTKAGVRALCGPPYRRTRWWAALFVAVVYFIGMSETATYITKSPRLLFGLTFRPDSPSGTYIFHFLFLHYVGGLTLIMLPISAVQTFRHRSAP